jgi:hypothetical protein
MRVLLREDRAVTGIVPGVSTVARGDDDTGRPGS